MGKTKISLQADVPHGDRRSPHSGSEAVGAGEWKFKLDILFVATCPVDLMSRRARLLHRVSWNFWRINRVTELSMFDRENG